MSGVLVVLLALLGAAPAGATPTPDPDLDSRALQVRVDRLTDQVEALEVRAEVAVESWNEVTAELDVLSAQEVEAQAGLDDAGRALHEDAAAATRRVRALYRSGGTVELAWTALSGAGFAEAATTYRTARVVLDSDAQAVERARDVVDVAVESSAEVQRLRRERAALEAETAVRLVEVEAALAEHEALLAGTDAALVAAVERERAEAEAAAIAYALAQAEARARAEAAADAAEASALAAAAIAGPSGGVVPAGFVGPDLDQQDVVERAAAAAPTPQAAAAIRAAATRLGSPYVWGATGPGTFDCSGLTMWSYRQAGVGLPRTSRQQYAGLRKVPVADMQPGDLLFYADGAAPSSIHHVSIYLGDGLQLTAPRAGDVVKISALWSKPVYGAVRPVG